MIRTRVIAAPLSCALFVLLVGCAAPVEPGAVAITPKANGLDVTTENPQRGVFPHQLQYLLLQR